MDQLNDDCQLRIIKYLDLTDQVLLWKATKHFSERLNANICRAWQQQLNFTLDWLMYDLEDDPEVMDAFLFSIRCYDGGLNEVGGNVDRYQEQNLSHKLSFK